MCRTWLITISNQKQRENRSTVFKTEFKPSEGFGNVIVEALAEG